ncbi:MAG: siderophore-interacting protein [Micropruina sp.]
MTGARPRADDRSKAAERVAAHRASGRGVTRIPYTIGIREATVLRRSWVTDRMVRLTFGGPGLDGTHTYAADDHVKLLFPDADGELRLPVPNERGMLDWPNPFPVDRTYTIRRYDAAARELDIDFVVHDGGLASDWAVTVGIGEAVPIAGPPGAAAFPDGCGHYLMVADSTALPAVARWLEEAPATARVDILTVVEHPAQRDYPLEHPGARVRWLDGTPCPDDLIALIEAVDDADPADTFLFAAGEAGLVKPLRRWAKRRGIDASIRGYWKRGVEGFDD